MLNLVEKHYETFISVDEVKQNLRVLHSDEDSFIGGLVDVACQYVQEVSGKRLNADTYAYIINAFCSPLLLPLKPAQSITSVQYFDEQNVSQTTTDYLFFSDEDNPRLTPPENQDWPATYDRYDAVTVTFVTGYPGSILFPENLKQAAIMLASHWYENRTPAGIRMEEIPHGADHLINLSKVGWYV